MPGMLDLESELDSIVDTTGICTAHVKGSTQHLCLKLSVSVKKQPGDMAAWQDCV
jgi:hypothetical protein